MEKKRLIAWLSELSKDDVKLVGGKGANLGEMYNSKFPVPPAFCVTTEAYHYFIESTRLREQIDEILRKITDVENTELLTQKASEIRELIINTEMPKDMREEIIEAYDHFNVDLGQIKGAPDALAIMRTAREPIFVAVRSSATAEDLSDASFAGQQDSFINVKGNDEVILNVKKVFASTFTARAIYYRLKKGFEAHVGICAVVQKMISSEKSGVIFSVDPVKTENVLIEAVFGQGEGIVSGRIKPDSYIVSRELELVSEKVSDKKIAIVRDSSGITKTVNLNEEKSKQKVLKTSEVLELADYALKLEKHYGKPQDIEFAIENGEIFIVQTRAITTLEKKKESEELEGKLLTKGLGASPGVASGVVKIIRSMGDLYKIKQGDVLVTQMTNPDMVVSMQKASAIVTDEGGITAHAAIVSREMGIPAVVGTENATSILEDGQEITVDGYNGKVFLGKAQGKKVEVLPVVPTKTKIKVLVDLPEFAERAAKTQAAGVGLVRLEGIIASEAKHPLYYEDNEKIDEYQKIIRTGLEKISYSFIGKEIWVRTSDIRTDEYSNLEGAPKQIERNPMLGFHGIRFSLKHQKIFRAELSAMKDLADKGHKFGIMFPQIITLEEVKAAKQVLEEMQVIGHPNIKWGVMIETPAAAMIIKEICKQGINFISFGTNDLTQYTLAIDRGNEEVQYLYNEMDPAVLKQLSRVIRECKAAKVETSICGQAASRKEMVEFLVGQGIDSLSVNADAALEISQFVKELEEKPKQNQKSLD
ncbi:Phosphoenolpyruvate synthase [uncultured archaeon]|nr:Phosphoenolpyruvate synthase [uncultured archaeon]